MSSKERVLTVYPDAMRHKEVSHAGSRVVTYTIMAGGRVIGASSLYGEERAWDYALNRILREAIYVPETHY